MPLRFNNALGIHEHALKARSQRAEVIAANLANANTPHYQARDIDFKTMLADAEGAGPLQATHGSHFRAASAGVSGALLYRTPSQPAIDGNTVEEQREIAAFSTNAVQYQTSLHLLGKRIKGLMSALKGE